MSDDIINNLHERGENYLRLHGHEDPVFGLAIAEIMHLRSRVKELVSLFSTGESND